MSTRLLGSRRSPTSLFVLILAVATPQMDAQETRFRRGDVDSSGEYDIGDPVLLLLHSFTGQPAALECEKSADANDDGALDIADAITLLGYLFLGADGLPAPFPGCGVDLTDDPLGCERSPSCPGSTPTGFLARLESRTVMPLGAELVGTVDGLSQEDFDFLGLTYDSQSQELRGPSLPLSGKWLEIDGQRFMTDRDGYLRLPVQPEAGSVPVYWRLEDTEPVTVLESLATVPDQDEPPVTFVPIYFAYPSHMDGEEEAAVEEEGAGEKGGVEICATAQIPPGHPFTNVKACCEDYLGPNGDGKRYVRTPPCLPLAVRNYYGSLCYEWTFLKRGKPCLNEGAINHVGPGCWKNHKYRNCQNLDENDFSFTRVRSNSDLAAFGVDVLFFGRNNTAANSTVLRVVPDVGEFEVPEGSGYRVVRDSSVGGWCVEQWSDSLETHYEDFNVIYRPPSQDPQGRCVANYRIIATADGLEETVELRLIPARSVWQGTATRTHIFDGLQEFDTFKEEKVSARIDSWDPESDQISGALTFELRTIDVPDCSGEGQQTVSLDAAPGLYFEFDYSNDPVTYEANSGSETVSFPFVYTCETETGTEIFNVNARVESRWLDTVSNNIPRFLSPDGCECRGSNVVLSFLQIFPTVYEWNLRMVPMAP